MAAAAQHLDAASRDPLAQHADGLRGSDGVLVTGHEQRGAYDPGGVGGPHVGERLAAAGIALRILAHERFADEGDGGRAPRPRLGREAGPDQGIRDGLHVPVARLGGAGPDGRAGRLGRRQQRAEEREAGHATGLRRGEMGGEDRAHRVRHHVGSVDPDALHDQARLVEEQRQGERTVGPRGPSRSGQVEPDGPEAREGGQHGSEGVGSPAEAVEHDDGLALSVGLDSHALDDHALSPVPHRVII